MSIDPNAVQRERLAAIDPISAIILHTGCTADEARAVMTQLGECGWGMLPVEATLDLTAAGLDPDQEIRARALEIASRSEARFGWELCEIAERYADWIRTGARPDAEPEPECACTPVPGRPNVRIANWDCPAHRDELARP